MNAKIKVQDPASGPEHPSFMVGSVTSKDGTLLGFRQIGRGPGVVIVHGSLSTGYYHLQLAGRLADSFTVYLPDRRGFGLSSPCGNGDGLQKDVEDLEALLAKTGARNVFGVSLGGILCLKAALSLSSISSLAVYEPPLFLNETAPAAMMTRFDREISQGKVAAALTTAMKGAPLMSDIFSAMPRGLLELMTGRMMAYEDQRQAGGYSTFRELAPTLHHDGRVIVEMSGKQESLRALRARVLLLGGSRSTTFLKAGLESIARVLPEAQRVVFPGLNHAASWNEDRGGQPGPVAQELRRFFGQPPACS